MSSAGEVTTAIKDSEGRQRQPHPPTATSSASPTAPSTPWAQTWPTWSWDLLEHMEAEDCDTLHACLPAKTYSDDADFRGPAVARIEEAYEDLEVDTHRGEPAVCIPSSSPVEYGGARWPHTARDSHALAIKSPKPMPPQRSERPGQTQRLRWRTAAFAALESRAHGVRRLGVHRALSAHAYVPTCRYPRRKSVAYRAASAGRCTIAGARSTRSKLKRPRPQLTLVEIGRRGRDGRADGHGAFASRGCMDQLKPGMPIAVAGKLEFNYGFKRMANPLTWSRLRRGSRPSRHDHPCAPCRARRSPPRGCAACVENALDMVRGCYDPLPLDLRDEIPAYVRARRRFRASISRNPWTRWPRRAAVWCTKSCCMLELVAYGTGAKPQRRRHPHRARGGRPVRGRA